MSKKTPGENSSAIGNRKTTPPNHVVRIRLVRLVFRPNRLVNLGWPCCNESRWLSRKTLGWRFASLSRRISDRLVIKSEGYVTLGWIHPGVWRDRWFEILYGRTYCYSAKLAFLISIFAGFDSGRSDLAGSAGSHGNLSLVAGLIFENSEKRWKR